MSIWRIKVLRDARFHCSVHNLIEQLQESRLSFRRNICFASHAGKPNCMLDTVRFLGFSAVNQP